MARDFYYVIIIVEHERLFYTQVVTCEFKNNKYYRIEDLTEYLKSGKGVTDEIIQNDGFVKAQSGHSIMLSPLR